MGSRSREIETEKFLFALFVLGIYLLARLAGIDLIECFINWAFSRFGQPPIG